MSDTKSKKKAKAKKGDDNCDSIEKEQEIEPKEERKDFIPTDAEAKEISSKPMSELTTVQILKYLAYKGKDDNATLKNGAIILWKKLTGTFKHRPFNGGGYRGGFRGGFRGGRSNDRMPHYNSFRRNESNNSFKEDRDDAPFSRKNNNNADAEADNEEQ
jgi:hypothetical protein